MKNKIVVLCIGVNHAPRPYTSLRFAQKDALYMAKHFEALGKRAQVTLLTGEDATRENIFQWLSQTNGINEKITVLIFFAGHASAQMTQWRPGADLRTNTHGDIEKNPPKMERCLWIARSKKSADRSHRLRSSQILEKMDNPLHNLIFIIDACYNFPGGKIPVSEIFDQFEESERNIKLPRYVIVSSSSITRVAFEDSRIRHGVLSYYVLRTLSGKKRFSLARRMPVFKFLSRLDRCVRKHPLSTNRGRFVTLEESTGNSIMVHCRDESFNLPILEPAPLIIDHGTPLLKQIGKKWKHVFTCTGLRRNVSIVMLFIAVLLMLFHLLNITTVKLLFHSKGYVLFAESMRETRGIQLTGLRGRQLTRKPSSYIQDFFYSQNHFFLFRYNWVPAMLSKLGEDGKIILCGKLLGIPIGGVSQSKLIKFALKNPDDIYYWHTRDVKRLINIIPSAYPQLRLKEKQQVFKLLANLGSPGAVLAAEIAALNGKMPQTIREHYLKYFYNPRLWQTHKHRLTPQDILYLKRTGKTIPGPLPPKLDTAVTVFLQQTANKLPRPPVTLTSRDHLLEIYRQLDILALFDYPFQQKADAILKNYFDPWEVISLLSDCKNITLAAWILDFYFEYFKTRRTKEIGPNQWFPIEKYIRQLQKKDKSFTWKQIIDSIYTILPQYTRSTIIMGLKDADPAVITLNCWQQWIYDYQIPSHLVIYPLIQMRHPSLIDFLESHFHYFESDFSADVFKILFDIDAVKTIALLKKVYPGSTPANRFKYAVFLFQQQFTQYEDDILKFLQSSIDPPHRKAILESARYGGFNTVLTKLASRHPHLEQKFKVLLPDKEMFYALQSFYYTHWPRQTLTMLEQMDITQDMMAGIRYINACLQLPDPFRKRLLMKVLKTATHETVRLNAESGLIRLYVPDADAAAKDIEPRKRIKKTYPGDFLQLVFQDNYKWLPHNSTRNHVVEAYTFMPHLFLLQQLRVHTGARNYNRVYLICDALQKKHSQKKTDIHQLQQILARAGTPVQRILLKELRRYVNTRVRGEH